MLMIKLYQISLMTLGHFRIEPNPEKKLSNLSEGQVNTKIF